MLYLQGVMRVKYRPHRGGLAEAMAEMREFETVEDIKKHVVSAWKSLPGFGDITEDNVIIGDVIGDDHRIGWKNVRYVILEGKERGVVGTIGD